MGIIFVDALLREDIAEFSENPILSPNDILAKFCMLFNAHYTETQNYDCLFFKDTSIDAESFHAQLDDFFSTGDVGNSVLINYNYRCHALLCRPTSFDVLLIVGYTV